MSEEKKEIKVPQVVPIRKFAQLLDLPASKILEILLKSEVTATINESIDFETAEIVGYELGYKILRAADAAREQISQIGKNLKSRPPVAVIMGHVDHGKTRLLDAIRKTNVIETESGGITQHIGAYQTEVEYKGKKRSITFLDTPGHEAFASIRAAGANVTDIAILVVAVNDGVKPQTIEAISHAKASGVPIIVALNKIDLPEADIEGTKRQLAEAGLLPEEWGGKVPMIPISAKSNLGIKDLLEMTLLVADLEELKANYSGLARGVIIDSKMHPGAGPLATVLIQQGVFNLGDYFCVGDTYGKARILQNFKGEKIEKAGPSTPIRIAGIKSLPQTGEILRVVNSEKEAKKEASEGKIQIGTIRKISGQTKGQKQANFVIRGDVQGSLEAIINAIEDMAIPDNEIAVNILSSGLGEVSENDIKLASSSNGIILAFRANVPLQVKKLAQEKKVEIKSYELIYKLIEEVYGLVSEMLSPEIKRLPLGKLRVLKIFKKGKGGICGGDVIEGKVKDKSSFEIVREGKVMGTGKIGTLQSENTTADTVSVGSQAGIGYQADGKIKVGDILNFYLIEETKRRVSSKRDL